MSSFNPWARVLEYGPRLKDNVAVYGPCNQLFFWLDGQGSAIRVGDYVEAGQESAASHAHGKLAAYDAARDQVKLQLLGAGETFAWYPRERVRYCPPSRKRALRQDALRRVA